MKINNKKKVIAAAGLVGIIALGTALGSMSYFTDTDTKTNTFTIGNVDIELLESSLHRTNASVYDGANVPRATSAAYSLFTGEIDGEGKVQNTNLPDNAGEAVDRVGSGGWSNKFYTDEQIIADAANYNTANDAVVPGYNVHKMPYIRNTGTTDAYVRTRVLIPASVYYAVDSGTPASYWTSTALSGPVASNAVDLYLNTLTTYDKADYANFTTAMENAGLTDTRCADDSDASTCVEYLVFDFTYQDILPAGEMTFWAPWGNIGVSKDATAEDLEDFDVIIEADGIQATGFADAAEAFAAFDAQI